MAAIAGYKGVVKGQTGIAAAFTLQPCTDIGTVARTVYQITDTTKRYWDTTAPLVEVSPNGSTGWVTQSAALYTVQPLGGTITFATPLANPSFVRVGGSAYPMAAFAQFRSWKGDVEVSMLEATTLGGSGQRAYIPGLMQGSFSVDGFWQDSYFFTKLTTRALCVIGFYVDSAGGHYDVYAYANKLGISDPVDGTVDETVDFTVSGSIVYYPTP